MQVYVCTYMCVHIRMHARAYMRVHCRPTENTESIQPWAMVPHPRTQVVLALNPSTAMSPGGRQGSLDRRAGRPLQS